MRTALAIALFGTLLIGATIAFPGAAPAGHLGQTQTVNGMTVYLGIVQVDTFGKYPDQYPKHAQGEFPSGKHVYHVMLALFKTADGERITDAIIEVTVAPLAFSGPRTPLHPTVVAGALTYCNYFRISPSDTYVIKAEIHRPGVARAIRAEFILERHSLCDRTCDRPN